MTTHPRLMPIPGCETHPVDEDEEHMNTVHNLMEGSEVMTVHEAALRLIDKISSVATDETFPVAKQVQNIVLALLEDNIKMKKEYVKMLQENEYLRETLHRIASYRTMCRNYDEDVGRPCRHFGENTVEDIEQMAINALVGDNDDK